jgi:hypothetical protein
MIHQFLAHPFLKFPALILGVVALATAQPGDAKTEKKDRGPQLKIACVTSLSEGQEVVLASLDKKGKWEEHGPLKLRASLVSDFLPASTGELHLALRGATGLESICKFTYPQGAKRALVTLVADPEKNLYNATVIDPEKLGFVQGSILILNSSPHSGSVSLGAKEEMVAAGQQRIAKPALEANRMYRMMVSYQNAAGETVLCYDRQVPGNATSRDVLFLLPDKTLGLKVLSLPIFGSLD